jgi:integrase
VLSGSLRQAVAWGWIPHNPARLATPPSVQRSDVAPPPVEQVAGLLATALERNPRLGLFLRLAVVLGARRGELCALRWHHVDLDQGEVLLERGVVYVSRQPLIDKPTKTRSKRRLALDTSTVELLRAHRERSEQVAKGLGFTLPGGSHAPVGGDPRGSQPGARGHRVATPRSPGDRHRGEGRWRGAVTQPVEFMSVGERIAIYRRRRGLSQLALAKLIGRSEILRHVVSSGSPSHPWKD